MGITRERMVDVVPHSAYQIPIHFIRWRSQDVRFCRNRLGSGLFDIDNGSDDNVSGTNPDDRNIVHKKMGMEPLTPIVND